jgi:hypothetical protein
MDDIVIADGTRDRSILTSSHPNQSVNEPIAFALAGPPRCTSCQAVTASHRCPPTRTSLGSSSVAVPERGKSERRAECHEYVPAQDVVSREGIERTSVDGDVQRKKGWILVEHIVGTDMHLYVWGYVPDG